MKARSKAASSSSERVAGSKGVRVDALALQGCEHARTAVQRHLALGERPPKSTATLPKSATSSSFHP
jgi:hypothetical protein